MAGARNLSAQDQTLDPPLHEDRSENLSQHRAGFTEDSERVGVVLLSQHGNVHHVQRFLLSGRMSVPRQNASPRHIILGDSVAVGPVEEADGWPSPGVRLNLSVDGQGEAQPGAEGNSGNAGMAGDVRFLHQSQHAGDGVMHEADRHGAVHAREPMAVCRCL